MRLVFLEKQYRSSSRIRLSNNRSPQLLTEVCSFSVNIGQRSIDWCAIFSRRFGALPTFVTGDFNTDKIARDGPWNILRSAGFLDSWYEAKVTDSCGSRGRSSRRDRSSICWLDLLKWFRCWHGDTNERRRVNNAKCCNT